MKFFFEKLIMAVSCIACLQSCQPSDRTITVSYPSPRPDSIPLKFMPGIVSTDELDFNSCYSPDGRTFYFCRSEKRKWTLYQTTFEDNAWSSPVRAPFDDSLYSEADPVFAPDGNLYYISNRPKDVNDTLRDFDIWSVTSLGENQWSKPTPMSIINSDSSEYYISFAGNGNLYFASSRHGGLGEEDLYVSHFTNREYTTPVNLGPQINSKGSDHDPLITKDERFLVFTSSGRQDSFGEADLYISKHAANNQWTSGKNLGKPFNTPTYEYCPYLSSDDQYFFYSSESDVKWVKAEYLYKKIPEE